MATQVIMPKQGLQMTEGLITRWLAQENEPVHEGSPLFEMETDKLTIEINAPASGTLLKILKQEGETVPVAEVIAWIGQPDEAIETAELAGVTPTEEDSGQPSKGVGMPVAATEHAQPPMPQGERVFASPRARTRAGEKGIDLRALQGSGPDGLIIERDVAQLSAVKATPLAAKIAEQAGIPIRSICGTGPRGKIMRSDVEAAVSQAGTTPAARQPVAGRLLPFSGVRKTIATRMLHSTQEMAQANHRMKVDMTEIIRMREKLKQDDRPVSYTDLLVKAVAVALKDFPILNATLTPEGILLLDAVHVGIAVSIGNGLVVPVIRDADCLSIREISACSADLIDKARNNRLIPEDYSGGTFTVTNLGMFDVDEFTAIINPPECAILAVGKIEKTPVVRDDAVVIRPIMTMSLTYDHRVVDGAPAAQFLQRVKQILQNPYLLI